MTIVSSKAIDPQKLSSDSKVEPEAAIEPIDRYAKGWDWNFEFAYLFHVIPNPLHSAVDLRIRNPNPTDYDFLTGMVGLRYRFTGVGGPWFLRGSAQLCGDLVGTDIIVGPETYFVGAAIGLHYDFIQRGWPIVPYIEFRGGPGLIDASHKYQGQSNDLEFTYLLGGGLRYDINSELSVKAGALDQHLSDFWIVPHNYGVDCLGFSIAVQKRF